MIALQSSREDLCSAGGPAIHQDDYWLGGQLPGLMRKYLQHSFYALQQHLCRILVSHLNFSMHGRQLEEENTLSSSMEEGPSQPENATHGAWHAALHTGLAWLHEGQCIGIRSGRKANRRQSATCLRGEAARLPGIVDDVSIAHCLGDRPARLQKVCCLSQGFLKHSTCNAHCMKQGYHVQQCAARVPHSAF